MKLASTTSSALAMIMVTHLTYALTSDQDMPINIQADEAVIEEKTGQYTYKGAVTIDQGTMKITADKVRITTGENNEVIEIVAFAGEDTLAHFEQQLDDDKDIVYADARQITYHVQEEKLSLEGDASLRQSKNTFQGQSLEYDVTTGKVDLKGGDGRVNIRLNPK